MYTQSWWWILMMSIHCTYMYEALWYASAREFIATGTVFALYMAGIEKVFPLLEFLFFSGDVNVEM